MRLDRKNILGYAFGVALIASVPRHAGATDEGRSAAAPDTTTTGITVLQSAWPSPSDSTPVYTLPEIHVEAKRWVPEMARLPLATTVVDRAAIETSGAMHAGDILRPLVGLRVATLGGPGSFAPVSIRGSSNDQVVVLVDGRRLNTAQGGGIDFSDLSLDNVDRIEVARGGASALYGSDAIGGAVNLVTRSPGAGRSASFRAEVGSFGTRLASGTLNGSAGPVGLRLGARLLDSEGDYSISDGSGAPARRENGALESRSVHGAVALRSATGTRLELKGSHDHARKGIPGPTEFPSATAVQEDERSALDLEMPSLPATLPLLSGRQAFTRIAAFAQRQIRDYADSAFALGAIHDRHRNDAFGGTIEHKRRLGAAGTLVAGAEYREDHLDSSSDGRRIRPARSVYARQVIDLGSWHVIPALRWDRVASFESAWSPRVLGSVEITEGLEARASVGRSFRPPSFDDLFFPARASAAGNPDLRPERSIDGDLGLTWKAGGWTRTVTLFHSRVTDLIQWQPGAAGVWRPHNVEGATIYGAEAEMQAEVSLPGFERPAWVSGNYTFLNATDASGDRNTGGKDLVYRPRHRANIELRLPVDRLTVETGWRYTGPVFTTRANTRNLPGYLVGDVGLLWRADRSASVELRSLNVTNATYQDLRDYPVPGRQWRLALVWKTGGDS